MPALCHRACYSKFKMTLQLLPSPFRQLTTRYLKRNTISLHLYLPASPFFLARRSGFRINLKTFQFLFLDIDVNVFLEGSTLPRAKTSDIRVSQAATPLCARQKLDEDQHQHPLIILVDIKVLSRGSRLPGDQKTYQIFPRRNKMRETTH